MLRYTVCMYSWSVRLVGDNRLNKIEVGQHIFLSVNFFIQNKKMGFKASRRSRRSRSIKCSRTSSRSRKSPSRGWRKSKPKSIASKRDMLSKCGKKCFLLPSKLKFPVCAKGTCKVDCRGLVAAKSRSGEWKYRGVYAKADRLIRSRGCTAKSRTKCRSSRR